MEMRVDSLRLHLELCFVWYGVSCLVSRFWFLVFWLESLSLSLVDNLEEEEAR